VVEGSVGSAPVIGLEPAG
jgi:hypothetical protein